MEREKFEDSLKHAFENAEITPTDKVWTNIELDLEKEKGGQLKKRLMFYQLLAAASVIFAMMIGGAGVYFNLNMRASDEQQLAGQAAPEQDDRLAGRASEAASPSAAHETEPGYASSLKNEKPATVHSEKQLSIAGPQRNDLAVNAPEEMKAAPREAGISSQSRTTNGAVMGTGRDASLTLTDGNEAEALVARRDLLSERPLPPLYMPREIQLNIPTADEQTVDPVVAMLARLEQREKEVHGTEEKEERDDLQENLWTSIGFAAGSFNNVQSSSPSSGPALASTSAMAAPIVDQETKASGYSYSMGVNVGTKVSRRWVLQGGLNYLTHASEYTANNVVVSTTSFQQQRFRAASTNELVNASEKDLSSKIVYSAPYNVNNSMRYLSIPLQAGYLLVNKTFGLQLNAGVATDLFLQNTIKADSDQLDKISQPGGSDSPYRTVNLSGLFGTELSYRFGNHYRVALNPGIRYPFNTIYKSDLGVQSAPLTFDVGLRFRYIFH